MNVDISQRQMDYNLGIGDPNKINNNETDDFSILWNDQTQTHSKLMDTNLDDIEMNDELLDKLVTAMLQDNTVDLHRNIEASDQPAQSQLSCNHEKHESNSMIGVPDSTLQVWQKLLEGDSVVELPQIKSSTNPSIILGQASQTPRSLVRRVSDDIFLRSLSRAHPRLIAASTPHKALPKTHFQVSSPIPCASAQSSAKREEVSSTNSGNQESPSNSSSLKSPLTRSSGPMTRSRSASKASHSDSHPRLPITPKSSTRYNLRARSSASSQSNANSCTSRSRNLSNVRQKTPKNSNSTPSHKYQTRSRTRSYKTKVIAPEKCCAKLAVVVRRVRMSVIARLQRGRSSNRLPTPQKELQPGSIPKTSVEPLRLPTPKKRLQPRRLSLRNAKVLVRRKSSRHASSKRKQ